MSLLSPVHVSLLMPSSTVADPLGTNMHAFAR
jgi:hypothetical protein